MISKERWNWALLDNSETIIERTDMQDLGTEIHKQQIKDIIAKQYSDFNKVLDAGCGDGTLGLKLKNAGFDVHCISLNDLEVEKCRDKGLHASKMDMHGLLFASDSFDMIYCCHSLEHSPAPFFALCEFNRVLKMGGVFIAILPFPIAAWIYFKTHYSVFNIEQIDALAEKSGYEMLELRAFESQDKQDDANNEYFMVFKKVKDFDKVERAYKGGEWNCKKFYKKN